jgi:N-acetylglucosamine-6-phosphate deacetylase
MSGTLFGNGLLLLDDGFSCADLLVRDGRIARIAPAIEPEPGDAVVDLCGDRLVPGFIDMHVHGGGGADFMDGSDDAIGAVRRTHARFGTTTLCPTTLTAPDDEISGFLAAVRRLMRVDDSDPSGGDGARIGGVHIEGPWLAPAQAGAQDPAYLRPPTVAHLERLLGSCEGGSTVTIAPELDGACECAGWLAARGVLPAMGHSDATLAQVRDGVACGFRHMTHFYSAMSAVKRKRGYRIPGMVEAGYLFDEVTVETIADGRHLPHELLRLVWKVKGTGRMALVTDAMRGAGMPEGTYRLGSLERGRDVIVEDGVARLPDRSGFAGSVCTMDRAVRTAVAAGIPLEDTLRMASATPARILGMQDRRGRLRPGFDADLAVLDDGLNVRMTVVGGRIVFDARNG